jgi:uncharacterized membrane protein YfcA
VDAGPLRDALTVGVGVITGVLSAAFGVGGAVLSTPGIRLLGASAFIAVGTTLPSIVPSAASGTVRYRRERLIDWRAVRWTAPVGVAAAVIGSLASHAVPGDGHWLMVATAGLLLFSAWRLWPARLASRDGPQHDDAPDGTLEGADRASPAAFAAVGAAAGALSGLLGIGGGVLMVPGFTEIVAIPIKRAIATSLVCVGVFAIPGTVTHALLGDIDWRFAAFLALGVIPGARLGASLAIRATDRRLQTVVALFFGLIALGYGTAEVVAAVR